MGVWARLAWGPRVLVTGAFWVSGVEASSPSPSSASSLGQGGINSLPGRFRMRSGLKGFVEVNEVGDYEEYEDEYVTEGEEVEEDWVDYEYVDLQKDSDGDGLRVRPHQNLFE